MRKSKYVSSLQRFPPIEATLSLYGLSGSIQELNPGRDNVSF